MRNGSRIFLDELTRYLLVGGSVLVAAVWVRNAVATHGAKQYGAMALAVVAAATFAVVGWETWEHRRTAPRAGRTLVARSSTWRAEVLRDSFIGLIIGCAWLYVRAEADHAAAIAACTVESEQMDRQTAEARLQMLEAQIEPHFLFNTLANVKRLYETDRAAGAGR